MEARPAGPVGSQQDRSLGDADLILTSTFEWRERDAAPRKLSRTFGRWKR